MLGEVGVGSSEEAHLGGTREALVLARVNVGTPEAGARAPTHPLGRGGGGPEIWPALPDRPENPGWVCRAEPLFVPRSLGSGRGGSVPEGLDSGQWRRQGCRWETRRCLHSRIPRAQACLTLRSATGRRGIGGQTEFSSPFLPASP